MKKLQEASETVPTAQLQLDKITNLHKLAKREQDKKVKPVLYGQVLVMLGLRPELITTYKALDELIQARIKELPSATL